MCTIYTIQLLSVGMKIGSMIVSRSRSIWVYLCVLTVLASGLGLEWDHAEFFPSFFPFSTRSTNTRQQSVAVELDKGKARATRHCVVSTDVKTCLNLDLPYVTTRQL